LAQGGNVVVVQGDVYIFVGAGLPAEDGIHRPAAVQPNLDTALGKEGQQAGRVSGGY
jgi:hypothetical protein